MGNDFGKANTQKKRDVREGAAHIPAANDGERASATHVTAVTIATCMKRDVHEALIMDPYVVMP